MHKKKKIKSLKLSPTTAHIIIEPGHKISAY